MCISVSDILFNIYRWFANIELMANSTITDAWTKFIWHMYFLCKAHHSHLAFRDTRQNFITMLGLSLNNKIINKKHKNAKKKKITSIKWTEKDPCSTSARRHVYRAIALHVSEWLQNCHQYLFGVTNMF